MLVGVPAFADPEPVVVVEDKAPHDVPKRKPTGTFEIGVGYSPDDGFIAHAEVVQPDLFRTGRKLALTADMSAIRQRAALTYDVPLSPNLTLNTGLFTQRRDFTRFAREGTGGELGLTYKLDRHTRIYGRYRIEAVAITDVVQQKPMHSIAEGSGTVATLGAGIVHDTLDGLIPRRGTRIEVFTERADPRWGSSTRFERSGGSLDLARAVGPLTLRLHGHAAFIRGDAPLSERLQHDGHAEVRGYALDSVSPLGSKLEAVGRVELETPSWKGLSLAAWFDAGMREDPDRSRDPLLQRSVGLSLIYRSPIGPMRLDVAVPLDGSRDRQYLLGIGGWSF